MKKAVQVVLLNDKGEVLAVSRKDNHRDFGLIGGKVDPEDADEISAAIREAKEETGLDISNLRLIFSMHKDGYMGYTYLADWSGEINYTEPHVVKWTAWQDVNLGSFGRWNSLVRESLLSMGIKIPLYPIPKKEYIFAVLLLDIDGPFVTLTSKESWINDKHCDDLYGEVWEDISILADNNEIGLGEVTESIYEITHKNRLLEDKEEIIRVMTEAGFIFDKEFDYEMNGLDSENVISFTKVSLPYGWLGNMSPHPVEFAGKQWKTTEALFQALRFNDEDIKEMIRGEKSPMTAKAVARDNDDKMSVLRMSEKDLDNMLLCLRLKLKYHPHLEKELLNTGKSIIIEDVTSRVKKDNKNDSNLFWGAAYIDGEWVGENNLGKLWMKLRDILA